MVCCLSDFKAWGRVKHIWEKYLSLYWIQVWSLPPNLAYFLQLEQLLMSYKSHTMTEAHERADLGVLIFGFWITYCIASRSTFGFFAIGAITDGLQVRALNVLTVFNADPPFMSVNGGGVLCREAFKNVLADFVRKGGTSPPHYGLTGCPIKRKSA